MLKRFLIFFLIFPFYILFGYLIFGTPGISVYIKIYFIGGCVIAGILFFIKKGRSVRNVFPINGSVDENYKRLFKEFSVGGSKIEEIEPIGGRQMIIHFNHPGWIYFFSMGIILFLAGIFPGLIWFITGRDKLSLTIKEEYGYVHVIFKTNNQKYVGKKWFKFQMKRTKELIGPTPEGSETTVKII